MTTPIPLENRNKKWPIPKTVRRRRIIIDGKEYNKCPYQDCDFMVEDKDFWVIDQGPQDQVDRHVEKQHGFVWFRKGKNAGWWPLAKFQQAREDFEKVRKNH